jgi:hypothetical protein
MHHPDAPIPHHFLDLAGSPPSLPSGCRRGEAREAAPLPLSSIFRGGDVSMVLMHQQQPAAPPSTHANLPSHARPALQCSPRSPPRPRLPVMSLPWPPLSHDGAGVLCVLLFRPGAMLSMPLLIRKWRQLQRSDAHGARQGALQTPGLDQRVQAAASQTRGTRAATSGGSLINAIGVEA